MVAYSFIARNISGWFRIKNPNLTFNQSLESTIKKEAQSSNIYKFIPSLEWFKQYHGELFKSDNIKDGDLLRCITDPTRTDSKINEILSADSNFRNMHVFKLINKAKENNENVFIIYGQNQVVVLEEEIKKMYQ